SCRLIARLALQVAEQQRLAVLVADTLQFLVQRPAQLLAIPVCRLPFGNGSRLPFERALADDSCSRAHGQPTSHAIQPAGYGRLPARGSGFEGENEKARLKALLRVLIMLKNAPAHAQDQSTVPPHKTRKCRFVALSRKAIEKLPVAPLIAGGSGQHPFEMCPP